MRLSIFLSVCRVKLLNGSFENITAEVTVNKDNWLHLGSHPLPNPDPEIFRRILHQCKVGGIFPQFGSYLWKKLIRSPLWKFHDKCNFGQGSPIKSGNHSYPDSKYGLLIWTRFTLAELCALLVRADANQPQTYRPGAHGGKSAPSRPKRAPYGSERGVINKNKNNNNNNNKLPLLQSSQNAQPTSVAQDSNAMPKLPRRTATRSQTRPVCNKRSHSF